MFSVMNYRLVNCALSSYISASKSVKVFLLLQFRIELWRGAFSRVVVRERDRRSLHFATLDFLLRLVALAKFMLLSLMKAANDVASCAAWQEIQVRSGRDDNFV
jgi:hypothetical protein